jgi:CUB/sushi domain-containing protein
MLIFFCTVKCPRGSTTVIGDCVLCPVGFYKEIEGNSECVPCPPGTNTLYEGARSSSDCRGSCRHSHNNLSYDFLFLAPCRPGSSSPSGLKPCSSCPIGSYQSDRGQKRCQHCPLGFSTARDGADDSALCLGTLPNCILSQCTVAVFYCRTVPPELLQ